MNVKDLVKLAAEALAEDRWWDFADRLADEVPAPGAGSPAPERKSGVRDGSFGKLEELSVDIEKETGHRFTVAQLRELRSTALAWPPGERDHDVEFEVHRRLRSPQAKGQLSMYKRRAEADYERAPGYQGSPRLTVHRLRVYKQDEKPMTPWSVQMTKAVKRLVNQAVTPEAIGELERLFAAAVNQRRAELHD